LTRPGDVRASNSTALLERIGLTRPGWTVLAVAVIGWFVAHLLGGRTLFLLVYGAVIVLVVARFLGRGRLAVTAERSKLPQRLRQGQGADVELSVTVPRRTGLFVLEERLHPQLGRTRRVPVAAGGGTEVEHRYAFTTKLRGVYEVGPLVAVWSDPFGLTRRETELLPAATVVVHPATEAVTDRPTTRQWEDPPVRPPTSRPWPSGFEFYGMRDYVLGDDLRRVVWRAVARTGRMMTRESEQGITDQVAVVLDTDVAWHTPGVPSDTFEAAVKTAASLACRHLHDGFSVSLFDGRGPLGQPGRGVRSKVPVLDALAAVQPGREPLVAALDRLVATGRRDAHTVVITPHVDQTVGARLRLLQERGTRIVLVVLTHENTHPETLRVANSVGGQLVVLRPLTSLDGSFRAAGEAAQALARLGR
jgi:uncharacterized protein (DUF58 family)